MVDEVESEPQEVEDIELEVVVDNEFEKFIKKLKDEAVRKNIKNKIKKIYQDPEIGKPLRYGRKGSREVRIKGHRLLYTYKNNVLTFNEIIPHKKQ